MNLPDLRQLSYDTRSARETGIALLIASSILAFFLLIPASPAPENLTSAAPNAFADIPLNAKAAIVYDLATGETLYEKNADAQLPLASLTKLLTVYAALAVLSPETQITIPENATSVEGLRIFSAGQTFAFRFGTLNFNSFA